MLIDSAGQLGTVSSSRRVKRDIHPLGALRSLMRLRPVSFRYRTGPPELHYGLIAEQVAKVLPELAVYGEDGLPETVQYQELPVLLLGELQRQQRREQLAGGREPPPAGPDRLADAPPLNAISDPGSRKRTAS